VTPDVTVAWGSWVVLGTSGVLLLGSLAAWMQVEQ
jgi:hypothetical protein